MSPPMQLVYVVFSLDMHKLMTPVFLLMQGRRTKENISDYSVSLNSFLRWSVYFTRLISQRYNKSLMGRLSFP